MHLKLLVLTPKISTHVLESNFLHGIAFIEMKATLHGYYLLSPIVPKPKPCVPEL
jgi:hypothetical protein